MMKSDRKPFTVNRKPRILIVNVNWLGDVLFSTPFVRAVHMMFPGCSIATLIHPRCREIVQNNPKIDEIILYDEEGVHRSLPGKIRLAGELRKKRFDIAFILHRSFTKAFLIFSAGVAERVGYATKKRRWLLTKAAEEPHQDVHTVEYFMKILTAADRLREEGAVPLSEIEATARDGYEFYPSVEDETYVDSLLKRTGIGRFGRFVVVNPGGNWMPKRWPKESYAELADAFAAEYGMKTVLTGAKKDARLAGEIRSLMKSALVDTSGETSLGQLGALMRRSALVVANDTGPMHIAVAVKAKVIALFGPTSPDITGPYGTGDYRVVSRNEECSVPCYKKGCGEYRCMNAISVRDVMRAAESLLTR
ncbi:MAG: lipopolysaccharide heptosyltransferase II [Candidatus Omnitrophota bacterium]